MKTVLSRDKVIRVYLVIYFLMVLMVSFTAFFSPFIAVNYTAFISVNSIVLFLTSFYIVGFGQLKSWFNDRKIEAARRADVRAAIRKEVEDKMKQLGYG